MRTLGQHLATRLVEIGVTHVFGVPGAYSLLRRAAAVRMCGSLKRLPSALHVTTCSCLQVISTWCCWIRYAVPVPWQPCLYSFVLPAC